MICATFGSIMMNLLYIVIAIIVLLTMVLIHELGHYVVGRLLGFTIVEFSIGFGKALWQTKNKRGEIISLRIFPLGGFCAFLGESDDDEDEKQPKSNLDKTNADQIVDVNPNEQEVKNSLESTENAQKTKKKQLEPITDGVKFNDQKPWKRILVYFAGVTFNFISAFIFAFIFLFVGGYDGYLLSPTEGYNVQYYSIETNQVLGELQQDTLVYAINGTEINYARGQVFASLVADNAESIVLTIDDNGTKLDVKIYRDQTDADGNDVFGINYTTVNIGYGFVEVLRDFIPFTLSISVLILKAFWQIITGQIALNQLGGPISTISQMTQVASYGFANFMYLLPLLAANLAIFNILPLPGLDGGHVVFTTIEWIRGKPIKRKVENAIHGWGIICLFAFVIIIDIIHMITA
ncbi:MAG: site-2 protease family protein [Clostridia bacterium]|nr:site-2 protease family protein [Clostridia bacterium]